MSDDYYADSMAHLDRFMNWLRGEEAKLLEAGKVGEEFECAHCQTRQSVKHYCYGNNLIAERHILKGRDVCHLCWDTELGKAVAECGY